MNHRRRWFPLFCVSLAACLVACGKSGGGAPTAPTSTSSTQTGGQVAGCEVTVQSSLLPLIDDPKSPYFDYIGVARSSDGATATGYGEALAHASAPDGTRLPDGSTGVYYHNGETGGAVWLARLTGTSLSPVGAISVDGVTRPRWISDPNTDLVNGRVRMIYMVGDGRRRFCVAESTDGLNFTTRALAIEFGGTEADPTVVQLRDGSWLMAFSRENHTGIGFARSSDGLTFTQFGTATYGVVPELAMTTDGRVRLYVCGGGGVISLLSSDGGTTWTSEGTVILRAVTSRAIVCDPTYIAADGIFIFKTTDAM
jgi:hypothetical protein